MTNNSNTDIIRNQIDALFDDTFYDILTPNFSSQNAFQSFLRTENIYLNSCNIDPDYKFLDIISYESCAHLIHILYSYMTCHIRINALTLLSNFFVYHYNLDMLLDKLIPILRPEYKTTLPLDSVFEQPLQEKLRYTYDSDTKQNADITRNYRSLLERIYKHEGYNVLANISKAKEQSHFNADTTDKYYIQPINVPFMLYYAVYHEGRIFNPQKPNITPRNKKPASLESYSSIQNDYLGSKLLTSFDSSDIEHAVFYTLLDNCFHFLQHLYMKKYLDEYSSSSFKNMLMQTFHINYEDIDNAIDYIIKSLLKENLLNAEYCSLIADPMYIFDIYFKYELKLAPINHRTLEQVVIQSIKNTIPVITTPRKCFYQIPKGKKRALYTHGDSIKKNISTIDSLEQIRRSLFTHGDSIKKNISTIDLLEQIRLHIEILKMNPFTQKYINTAKSLSNTDNKIEGVFYNPLRSLLL